MDPFAKSAGLGGLYDQSPGKINQNVKQNINFRVKVKSRVYWYCFKQYSDNYKSYQEFINYTGNKFSFRREFKQDIRKIFKK
jgi:hypothetical protein